MTITRTDEPTSRKPLRLWPGVVAVLLQWLVRFVLPLILPEALLIGVIGEFVGALLIIVWWLFFSRAPWSERLGGLGLMIVALAATRPILHESVATGGMGLLFYMYAIPVLCLAFVGWAVATRHLADRPRRVAMVATILLACVAWAFVRTGGISGSAHSDFRWRWSKTPEERLLAQAGHEPTELPSTPAEAGAEWPGFRGPERDSIVRGVRIATDWTASPPVELWRQPIGPGWSSFAVRGDVFFTQEQRGDDEVVSCYSMTTGKPVWRHGDAARFWESNAGAGPRATPTLSNGRVYTLGATGIVNALDAADGSVVWSRNAASDTDTKVPGWGFSGSPLVLGDAVVIAAAGTLVAYDLATGEPRWRGPHSDNGYSSPQLLTIDGVQQIVLLRGPGATGVAPGDGQVLWEHALPSGARIVQPAMTADGDVLLTVGDYGDGNSIRRVAVAHASAGWTSQERWVSRGLKPNFNDFVVHQGHAFGFDGSILSCIDLADGKRKWKGGRYGNGQLLLLADQGLLLVLSEEGELALVSATSDRFTELARVPAIEGKTWNHPVLVGDVLLVRNDQQMAAFRLTRLG